MRKKTKLFGSIAAICASICMMVIGVLAATQVGLNVTSSVSFESNGAYVKVKGEVQKGNASTEPILASEPENSDYYYIGYSYDAVDEEQETDTKVSDYNDTPVGTSSSSPMTSWTIGNVEFSETESIIRYSLTFTNYSEKPLQATITTNKDTFLSDPETQGKVSINETSTSLIIGGYDGTTPQTATYSITLTLTNFSTSFTNKSLTIDVNFSTEIIPQEIDLNGLEYEILPGTNNVEITGYTGSAKNIVIPKGFAFVGKEMPNSFIWEDMNSDSSEVEEILLCLGDFNITFGNGTRRESMNFYEFQLEVQSGGIGEDSFPMTFEQTFNLKIENNEADLEMLMGYMQSISDSFSMGLGIEFLRLKENGSEWKEFNTVDEFMEYLSSFNSPEELNFPLEFEMEPPKRIVMVEGDEYTVTSIGDHAFRGCSSLASIEIPSSVTSIGNSTFRDCSSLQITVASDNAYYSSDNGSLYNKAQTELIRGAGGVSTVNILDTVTSIGDRAFNGCSSLASIEIPSSVTSIGDRAFSRCSSLASVKFGTNSQLTSIGDRAFYGCSSLTSIEIPSSVTSIGYLAFYDCNSLTSVIFEDPNGWEVGYRGDRKDLSATDLSDPSTAARYLKDTYNGRYWEKS